MFCSVTIGKCQNEMMKKFFPTTYNNDLKIEQECTDKYMYRINDDVKMMDINLSVIFQTIFGQNV